MTTNASFPRSKRLLQAGEYSRVFAKNIRVSDRYWTILATKTDGPCSRLGMAIAKKRAKRAVDRNRLKRLIRQHFREQESSPFIVDMVVMNRDSATKASNQELRQSLDGLWIKLSKQLGKQVERLP